MPNLNWKDKNDLSFKHDSLEPLREYPFKELELNENPLHYIEGEKGEIKEFPQYNVQDIRKTVGKLPNEDYWRNTLIWGDNEAVLHSLIKLFKRKITLIYIDPPFATGGDFHYKLMVGREASKISLKAYSDVWKEGIESYLTYLAKRLVLMKELLSDEGSIYLHLDWHISHYIKIIMDEIFGKENFRNEIIWAYPAASARTRRFFIRSYDSILFYTKTDDYVFNDDPNIYQEYSERVKRALKKDENGTFYYRGGSHNGKKLSRKVYIKRNGIFPRDMWNDIPFIRANTQEYQGFSTQKPERLLKRIILASSNEKDLIADFFCGSGTTIAVAEKLKRHWIGCDLAKHSIDINRKRLLEISRDKHVSFQILKLKELKKELLIPDDLIKEDLKNSEIKRKLSELDLEVRIIRNDGESLVIELINFQHPFNDIITDKIKGKIQTWSDWIDCWLIDFEHQEDIFNVGWCAFRSPKKRHLSLIAGPFQHDELAEKRKIAIKIIDLFGNEVVKIIK